MAKVFGKKVSADLLMEAVEHALKVFVGVTKGFVMADIGDNNVVVWQLGCSIDELLTQCVDAYAELCLEGFGFVLDVDDGLVIANWNVWVRDARLAHHQDDLGTLGCSNGTVDAHKFYLVVGVTDTCSVNKTEGDAAELDGVFDSVARGALNVTYDGTFFA